MRFLRSEIVLNLFQRIDHLIDLFACNIFFHRCNDLLDDGFCPQIGFPAQRSNKNVVYTSVFKALSAFYVGLFLHLRQHPCKRGLIPECQKCKFILVTSILFMKFFQDNHLFLAQLQALF